MMKRILSTLLLGLAAIMALSAQTRYPKEIYSGAWNAGHVQGITMDREGYMYFSFTDVIVKTDLQGRLIGTVTGLLGHLEYPQTEPVRPQIQQYVLHRDHRRV